MYRFLGAQLHTQCLFINEEKPQHSTQRKGNPTTFPSFTDMFALLSPHNVNTLEHFSMDTLEREEVVTSRLLRRINQHIYEHSCQSPQHYSNYRSDVTVSEE